MNMNFNNERHKKPEKQLSYKDSSIKPYLLCNFKVCKGDGYVYATNVTTGEKRCFLCQCSTKESQMTVWNEKFRDEYKPDFEGMANE